MANNVTREKNLEALANAIKNYADSKVATITGGGASYILPTASETLKGGVMIGTGLSMAGDTLNVTLSGGQSYFDFTGATSVIGGASGFVPAPKAGDNEKFLRGDGQWVSPTSLTPEQIQKIINFDPDDYMLKEETTIAVDVQSVLLDTTEGTEAVTVTTNSDGEIVATSADTLVCTANVSDNVVTIAPASARGLTSVSIYVKRSGSHVMSETLTIPVAVTAGDAIDMLADRTLADVQEIFQNGQGKTYFKDGDYFDITMPTTVTLQYKIDGEYTTIPEGSTWRCVLLGIDHNSELEGNNRGHFAICQNTDGVHIAFQGRTLNNSNTNKGGWAGCVFKTWLNSTFYDALPTDLQNVMVETVKYTDNRSSGSGNVEANVTASSQKMWLVAEFEYAGTRKNANSYEKYKQAQYDYYKKRGAIIHYTHHTPTTASWVWTRSPYYNETNLFVQINNSGAAGEGGNAHTQNNGGTAANKGFMPCFCIGGASNE